jgi:hypothetical protein
MGKRAGCRDAALQLAYRFEEVMQADLSSAERGEGV